MRAVAVYGKASHAKSKPWRSEPGRSAERAARYCMRSALAAPGQSGRTRRREISAVAPRRTNGGLWAWAAGACKARCEARCPHARWAVPCSTCCNVATHMLQRCNTHCNVATHVATHIATLQHTWRAHARRAGARAVFRGEACANTRCNTRRSGTRAERVRRRLCAGCCSRCSGRGVGIGRLGARLRQVDGARLDRARHAQGLVRGLTWATAPHRCT